MDFADMGFTTKQWFIINTGAIRTIKFDESTGTWNVAFKAQQEMENLDPMDYGSIEELLSDARRANTISEECEDDEDDEDEDEE